MVSQTISEQLRALGVYLDPEKVQKIVRLLKGKATVYKISEVEKVAVKHTVRKYAELWKTGQLDFLEGPFDEALPTQSISFRSTVLSISTCQRERKFLIYSHTPQLYTLALLTAIVFSPTPRMRGPAGLLR